MAEGKEATILTIEEIKKQLRKRYKWYQCPKKSDRIELMEDQWKQIDWTHEEMERNAALPHKMWNMRHDDHLWPGCHEWRGDDAYGYRAGEGHAKFMPRLPKLVEGRGIARWMADGDASVVEVPQLADYRTIWTPDNMPEVIEFWERRPGHSDFGKWIRWSKKNFLRIYAPSALQKFSKRSSLLREPLHKSFHFMIKQNEKAWKLKSETGADWVLLKRDGWRWDSYDGYMIKDAHYIGLRWN